MVVIVQCLWFVENRERFSPKDARLGKENILEWNHDLGFTGYGIDDFMSSEKRRLPIFDWFERTFEEDNAGVYLPNVETLSKMMNNQYNELKKKIPVLTIERHQVSFQSKTKQVCFLLSTNIYSPLYHFSEEKWTLPLWHKEVCRSLFLERDSGFVQKEFQYNQ